MVLVVMAVLVLLIYIWGCHDDILFNDAWTGSLASKNKTLATRPRLGQAYDESIKQWIIEKYRGSNCSIRKTNTNRCISSSRYPPCTLDLLRKFTIENDNFADGGYWATDGSQDTFCPSFCNFNNDWMHTKRCGITRRPAIKITVIGGSTGAYLATGLISTLEKRGFQCSTRREEDTLRLNRKRRRNIKYFSVRGMPEKTLGAPPSLYRGKLDKCFAKRCVFITDNNSTKQEKHNLLSFDVEYISHTEVLETTLRLKSPSANRSEQFSTFTEYVLRCYLPQHGYPDLLLFYAQFHHQKWHSTFSKAATEIQYVHSLLEAFVPPTTKIMWLPAHRECLKLSEDNNDKYPRGNDLDANRLIHGLNHVLYAILSPVLKNQNGNIYGFFDFAEMSCSYRCVSHLDAVT